MCSLLLRIHGSQVRGGDTKVQVVCIGGLTVVWGLVGDVDDVHVHLHLSRGREAVEQVGDREVRRHLGTGNVYGWRRVGRARKEKDGNVVLRGQHAALRQHVGVAERVVQGSRRVEHGEGAVDPEGDGPDRHAVRSWRVQRRLRDQRAHLRFPEGGWLHRDHGRAVAHAVRRAEHRVGRDQRAGALVHVRPGLSQADDRVCNVADLRVPGVAGSVVAIGALHAQSAGGQRGAGRHGRGRQRRWRGRPRRPRRPDVLGRVAARRRERRRGGPAASGGEHGRRVAAGAQAAAEVHGGACQRVGVIPRVRAPAAGGDEDGRFHVALAARVCKTQGDGGHAGHVGVRQRRRKVASRLSSAGGEFGRLLRG